MCFSGRRKHPRKDLMPFRFFESDMRLFSRKVRTDVRIEKDFAEFVKLLNKHKVRYLIVGAYAVSFHARPRFTSDIDFLVEPKKENVERLLRVLKDFGFGMIGLRDKDFLDSNMVVQLGYEPVRIDILSSIPGVDFVAAYNSKVGGKFGRQKAWFISLDDLLRNKRAVKRKQDVADVAALQKARRVKAKKKTTS